MKYFKYLFFSFIFILIGVVGVKADEVSISQFTYCEECLLSRTDGITFVDSTSGWDPIYFDTTSYLVLSNSDTFSLSLSVDSSAPTFLYYYDSNFNFISSTNIYFSDSSVPYYFVPPSNAFYFRVSYLRTRSTSISYNYSFIFNSSFDTFSLNFFTQSISFVSDIISDLVSILIGNTIILVIFAFIVVGGVIYIIYRIKHIN